ncbi:MAG: biopolymer transporter ExbD [Nitrospiraceae bacterium]|nr:biopolymer transporter ExbD [Nitrospiraceae bacterium]
MKSPTRGSMSDINVTPLVDVMLVLLVIFMVTAPLMRQGIDVNLPKARGRPLPAEQRISIAIARGGSIHMNGATLDLEQLKARLSMLSKTDPDVYLKADRDVSYGRVALVMGEIRAAGIKKLGIVTEPLKNR